MDVHVSVKYDWVGKISHVLSALDTSSIGSYFFITCGTHLLVRGWSHALDARDTSSIGSYFFIMCGAHLLVTGWSHALDA